MAVDATDATFERDVLDRSTDVPVVVDLWAPWCGPCKQLTPILEKVVGATEGKVELVKVNIDENPQVQAAFRVQSIPAVFALRNRQVVDHFVGALPERSVQEFIDRLAGKPASEADLLAAQGDERSLRAALELEPDHNDAILDLAELLIGRGGDASRTEAMALLERIPETAEVRRLQALARMGGEAAVADDIDDKLLSLLDRVKDDETARQEYLDILEVLGPDDPRTAQYRRALSSRLF